MTQAENSTSNPQFPLSKRMLIGAAIGLMVICVFILPINQPNPAWGQFWMIRPLIMVPFAGAMGGLCNYYILQFHNQIGLNKTVAIILSVIVSIVGLWMGIVLGLVGTLWN